MCILPTGTDPKPPHTHARERERERKREGERAGGREAGRQGGREGERERERGREGGSDLISLKPSNHRDSSREPTDQQPSQARIRHTRSLSCLLK
jgi:hypothetical protein